MSWNGTKFHVDKITRKPSGQFELRARDSRSAGGSKAIFINYAPGKDGAAKIEVLESLRNGHRAYGGDFQFP